MSSKILLPAALVVVALPAAAWDNGCSARADRRADIDAAGADRVEIVAGAGDLEVYGVSDTKTVHATGRACADSEDVLARINLSAERDGSTLRIVAEIPPGTDEAYLDFRVDLPAAAGEEDSSGDISVKKVAALDLRDSSGDVDINDVPGKLTLEDSSGDLYVADAGDVDVVSDSSGDIRISHVQSVRIEVDSSGEINVRDVKGNVIIGDVSSGSIDVSDVAGDFSVAHDGSGDIDYSNVSGKVSIPDNKHSD
jgi:hypothetical protein